jgi:imidazoleglycerol-phosphate dehydratase
MAERTATIERQTKETGVELSLNLDGEGRGEVTTGVGFLDHMLVLLSKHALFDLTVNASGDTEVDDHHTVEDVGICLGQALDQALGDRRGITRYGFACVPMDETLADAAVDISGRPYTVVNVAFPDSKVGSFDVALTKEFLHAVAVHAKLTLHVNLRYGDNSHHINEAVFKALARALGQAVSLNPRQKDVPSSKGVL